MSTMTQSSKWWAHFCVPSVTSRTFGSRAMGASRDSMRRAVCRSSGTAPASSKSPTATHTGRSSMAMTESSSAAVAVS